MIKGSTTSGFNYQIEKERLNNYELLEIIGELDTNPLVIGTIVKLLLGEEQTTQLKEHIRTEDGYVPVDLMTTEITEIFQNQSETKNS